MALDQMAKAAAFHTLHRRQGAFVIPNPWDAGTARILAKLGFEALATTSAGLAFALGRRDSERAVTRDETLANAAAIAAATDLPVSADLENGFSDAPRAGGADNSTFGANRDCRRFDRGCRFLGRSENAVRLQSYVALIAFLLLRILHQTAARSFKDGTALLLTRLKLARFGPLNLCQQATPPPKPPALRPPRPQACFTFQ